MPFVSRLLAVSALALLALPAARPSVAQDAKSFYAGKTLKIIVGLPPGGGADAYARLVQRHLGRHRSEEHTSEFQSHVNLVCRLLLEKKKGQRPVQILTVTLHQMLTRRLRHVSAGPLVSADL